MNEPSSALRVAAIEMAARGIQAAKLQMIGRSGEPWEATAVVTARVPAAEPRLAGTPWRVNAEVPRDELLCRFRPEGGEGEPIGRATSPGMVSDSAAADPLQVAWSLADLNGCGKPNCGDSAAVLGLRMGDM